MLIPMVGTLTNAPAIPAYIDQLRGQGVAKELTAAQMAAQLKAQGIDLEALTAEILPSLTPAQRELVQSQLGQTVPSSTSCPSRRGCWSSPIRARSSRSTRSTRR